MEGTWTTARGKAVRGGGRKSGGVREHHEEGDECAYEMAVEGVCTWRQQWRSLTTVKPRNLRCTIRIGCVTAEGGSLPSECHSQWSKACHSLRPNALEGMSSILGVHIHPHISPPIKTLAPPQRPSHPHPHVPCRRDVASAEMTAPPPHVSRPPSLARTVPESPSRCRYPISLSATITSHSRC